MALYDAMNDDDDQVRAIAASATRSILGEDLMPIEAATQLLQWLGQRLGNQEDFRSLIACRLAGNTRTPSRVAAGLFDWEPAPEQLASAMRLDDSLFVIEEKNLFIDEVREIKRWKAVLESLEYDTKEEWFQVLRGWTTDGLRALKNLTLEQEDGPMGWTSEPKVFAMCARILLCGVAIRASESCEDIRELLDGVREAGRRRGLHGLLLEMVDEIST
jgi:hypothetical protein